MKKIQFSAIVGLALSSISVYASSTDPCAFAIKSVGRLENILWEITGLQPKCVVETPTKGKGDVSFYYTAPVSCKLVGKLDYVGKLDVNKALMDRGLNGYKVVLENNAILVNGATSTRDCANYFAIGSASEVEKACAEKAKNVASISNTIAKILGIKPSCIAKDAELVHVDANDHYYVSGLRCSVPKRRFKVDIDALTDALEQKGYHGYTVSAGKDSFRIGGTLSGQRCSSYSGTGPDVGSDSTGANHAK